MNADITELIASHPDPRGQRVHAPDEGSFAQSLRLFSSGVPAFAQHISVEILWTLLYFNSPVNSERIARLLCNSATKCRGLEM